MTLAILDDLGAIILIALFFTANLSLLSIAFSTVAIAILITLNRLRVMKLGPYLITGVILWVCVLKSGVHATLAGVVIAFAIPGHAAEPQMTPPLRHLITMLHPWVAFGILPLFAFVNAGVSFEGLNIAAIFAPVPLGIMLGLFVGKQLGVFAAVWAVVRLNFASLPTLLCGIGFTMSIFIGSLAFAENAFGYARVDRLAVIIGSLLSGLIGYLILIIAGRRRAVSH
jgi:NhaA family Na+:H+ antiporter